MAKKSVLAAVAPMLLSLIPASPVGVTTASSPPGEIVIDGASPDWTRRVEWGLARFDEAGLRLPPMVVTIHGSDDTAGCNGNSGLFRPAHPAEVHLCLSNPDNGAAQLTTLHELAHAWAETQLTSAEQDAFVTLRGLDVWADPRVARYEWGAEHAAEVVSWGLMDEPSPIIRIYDARPDQLLIAFNELVGRPPRWTSS